MSDDLGVIDAALPWTIPLYLLVTHFVADFLLQTDWMALNKSRWNTSMEGAKALLTHVGVYSACFAWFGLEFATLTGLLHLVTDGITSKITAKLWQAGERHWFFTMIGADQLLHYIALWGVWTWLT